MVSFFAATSTKNEWRLASDRTISILHDGVMGNAAHRLRIATRDFPQASIDSCCCQEDDPNAPQRGRHDKGICSDALGRSVGPFWGVLPCGGLGAAPPESSCFLPFPSMQNALLRTFSPSSFQRAPTRALVATPLGGAVGQGSVLPCGGLGAAPPESFCFLPFPSMQNVLPRTFSPSSFQRAPTRAL